METGNWSDLLNAAIVEDLGETGDVTSRALFDDEIGSASLLAKDDGVIAGLECFRETYARVDHGVRVETLVSDGDRLKVGQSVLTVTGRVVSILQGERIAVNILSYLSGIATQTRRFVDAAAAGGRAKILDTRKTIPAFRALAKYAVRIGGGHNHRMGLYDMVLIKDNHIDAVGSIKQAVAKVRAAWGERYRIEVECRNLDEVREALASDVKLIMLDNMDVETTAAAVAVGAGSAEFEASGNMSIERVAEYSRVGVDYISVGSLTHSVRSFDFSLRMSGPE